jgi:hypothetical protein
MKGMVYTYPPFPSTSAGVVSFLIGLVEWVIEIPLIALANFILSITGAASTAGANSTGAVLGFIAATWNNSIQAFSAFGVLAPILAAAIWGFALLILIFFVFKAVQLAIRETEED